MQHLKSGLISLSYFSILVLFQAIDTVGQYPPVVYDVLLNSHDNLFIFQVIRLISPPVSWKSWVGINPLAI